MLKEISIEIIRKCPNRCLHCSSLSHPQCEETIPFDTFKEVVSDAARLGARVICLSGGEPFLHERIVDMIRAVSELGMDCYIYTSGISMDASGQPTALPEDSLRQIAGYVTKLIFNIEAGTEAVYDKIMGTENCFGKLRQSALRAAEAGICTEAHFVPMAVNLEEIDPVIRLCKDLHISKLSFLRLVLHGRARQHAETLALTEEETTGLKERLREIQARSELPVRIGVPLLTDTACHTCEAARGKLNIKYDGEVFPCEVFKNYSMEKSLGRLQPDSIYRRSLAEIYHTSEYLRHVRERSSRFSDAGGCETCIGQYLIQMEEKR